MCTVMSVFAVIKTPITYRDNAHYSVFRGNIHCSISITILNKQIMGYYTIRNDPINNGWMETEEEAEMCREQGET